MSKVHCINLALGHMIRRQHPLSLSLATGLLEERCSELDFLLVRGTLRMKCHALKPSCLDGLGLSVPRLYIQSREEVPDTEHLQRLVDKCASISTTVAA